MAAVLSGAIAYFFNKRMRLSATQHALIRIVAANSDLPSGVTLGNKDITTIEWPSALPLPGSFTKVEDVVGRPLIYPLGAKEPVLKRDLGVEGSGIGLSAKIPAGMRATAVRSNEIVGVAGFLYPGSPRPTRQARTSQRCDLAVKPRGLPKAAAGKPAGNDSVCIA